MEFTKLFSQSEVDRVHEASLEILENVGMLVRNEKALAIFAKNGCQVDMQTMMVKFPREVVEKARKSFVPTYTFTAQDPKFDVTMPGDRPIVVTGSSAPNIIDPITGEERRATSSDIANIAYLQHNVRLMNWIENHKAEMETLGKSL